MSNAKNQEHQLIEKLLEGNKAALRRFYHEYHQRLKHYLIPKITPKKDREEIIQDVFIAFLDALPLFNQNSSLWTFLVSIARHEVADYYRKKYAKKAIKSVPLVNAIYDRKLYSSKKTAQNLVAMVETVYQKISHSNERILRLKYEDGLSVKQIAKKLNLTAKAAESKLYRARMAFQDQYTKLYGEPNFAVLPQTDD